MEKRRIDWNFACDIYGIAPNIDHREQLFHFFKNWVNIQNIIFWDAGKAYLIGKNNENNCIQYPNNGCPDEKCSIYTSESTRKTKCVSKERMKIYPGNIFDNTNEYRINSKNKNKQYKIIKKMELQQYTANSKKIIYISYCFLQDIETEDLYIIFGPGVVYNENELYTQEILGILDNIANNILEILSKKRLRNIILCGHSFGCVLAQIIGILLIKKSMELINNLWIIGSAPFLWLREEDIVYYQAFIEANRIIIFGLYCNLYDEELNGEILKDPYLFDGDPKLMRSKILHRPKRKMRQIKTYL
jgi:hypothetical protein